MFQSYIIDEKDKDYSTEEAKREGNQLEDDGIMRLKDNKIPKGMVSLERIFYLDIPPEKYKNQSLGDQTITINLGTPNQPQNMNIGSTCTKDEQENLQYLLL